MEHRWKVLMVTAVAVFRGFLDVSRSDLSWVLNAYTLKGFSDAYTLMAGVAVLTALPALALGRVRVAAPARVATAEAPAG
jgi:hypothetical protein